MTELERALVALGHELDLPESPELAPMVIADLGPRRTVARRRLVLVVAVVLGAALVATLAIPDARSAFLRVLRIGGDRIELVEQFPVAPTDSELELTLGLRVTLDEARERAGFDLLELREEPDGVYLGERGTVWFLYGTRASIRLLVAQTPALDVDEPLLLKKLATSGTRVEAVVVRGGGAYFLSGEPHVVLLLDELGYVVEETARSRRTSSSGTRTVVPFGSRAT